MSAKAFQDLKFSGGPAPLDLEVRLVGSQTEHITQVSLIAQRADGTQVQAVPKGDGKYFFPEVGAKPTLMFTDKQLSSNMIEFAFDPEATNVYVSVLMDPQTGAVKSITSKPQYPNNHRNTGKFGIGGGSSSGPPANDDCADAIEIFDGVTAFSTVGATTDGPVEGACEFDGQTYHDIWYVYTATCDGTLTVSTCDDADYDTDLVVYDGTDCGALSLLGCDDDTAGCGGFTTSLDVPVTQGNGYLVRVGGFDDGDFGSGNLTLTCQGAASNDDCEGAVDVPCDSSITFDNTANTTDPTDPEFSCHFGGSAQGVGTTWFTFVATDTTAFVDTNLSTGATDTLLAVYSGTCGNLTEIACSEDEGVGLLSEVCAEGLTPGETYYVQVASFSDTSTGEITLSITCPCPGAPIGRCCFDGGMCADVTEDECAALGGDWDEFLTCANDPCPVPPDNDDCEDAEDVGMLPASVFFDNTAAVTDNDDLLCGVFSGPFRNVWYTVEGTGNTMTATTCNAGTIVSDTKISVFCGDCMSLECVDGNDDDCDDFQTFSSTVSWCSQPGVTYFISVGNFSDTTTPGVIQLDVSDDGVACSPEVFCLPVGACCLPSGECEELTEADCAAAGGDYFGDGTTCDNNAVADGSFEAGAFSGNWIEESLNFGTPLCTLGGCGAGGGTGPNTGDWWAWFGGIFAFETGAVEQSVVIPAGTTELSFFLEIPVASTNGTDFLRVVIDGNTELTILESEGPYLGYVKRTVDISGYADDGAHSIRFESEISGTPDLTNFFVDDVSINSPAVSCTEDYCIDFSADDSGAPLANGQDISGNEVTGLFSVSSSGFNQGAAIFDSDPAGPNAAGPDPDLLVDTGNMLILQDNVDSTQTTSGIFDVPNDSVLGGSITFDFAGPTTVTSIDLCEIDLGIQDAAVTLIDGNGLTRTYLVPNGWTNDIIDDGPPGILTLDCTTLADQPGVNATATASEDAGFDPANVASMVVDFASSASLDNLKFTQ